MNQTYETFYFDSANGESRVFVRRWLPPGQPRGLLLIAHGMAEHSGRYQEFAEYLATRGWLVVAHDHIGHGQSVAKGQRYGYFSGADGWAAALADMEHIRAAQQQEYPALPCFMLGHSMGSFLLRSYLIDYAPTKLSGAILSGSGQMQPIKLKLGGLVIWLEYKRLSAKGLSPLLYLVIQGGYNRRFRPIRTPVDWLSRDTAMVDAYLADSFCRKLPTVGLYQQIRDSFINNIKPQNLRRMNPDLPVLFISGANDPVGHEGRSVQQLCSAFKAVGCRDVRLKLYAEGRHAMLHELNRNQVYADIAAWLEEKTEKKT